jgi:hypothetical protein
MIQTTTDLLLGGYVQNKNFSSFIKAFTVPHDTTTLMLMESQPRYIVQPEQRRDLLLFSEFKADTDFAPYTSGRIFHAYGELRWERHSSQVQVVYTGDAQYAPELPPNEPQTLKECERVIRNYLLFGKRLEEPQRLRIGSAAQPGDFAEVRIPRLLRYPTLPELANAQRIQLAVCEYMDQITGVNVAYRFQGLVPFQQSGEPEQEEVER